MSFCIPINIVYVYYLWYFGLETGFSFCIARNYVPVYLSIAQLLARVNYGIKMRYFMCIFLTLLHLLLFVTMLSAVRLKFIVLVCLFYSTFTCYTFRYCCIFFFVFIRHYFWHLRLCIIRHNMHRDLGLSETLIPSVLPRNTSRCL